MFKATGALVALVALTVLGFVLWDQYTAQERAQERAAQTAQRQASDEAESARRLEAYAEQERQRKQAEAEQENQRQAIAAAEAEQVAAFETRRKAALQSVVPVATNMTCTIPLLGCGNYRLTTTVANKSNETISSVALGWVFLLEGTRNCPSTVPTKRYEQVILPPGATTVFNMDGLDGPTGRSPFCVFVTDVKLAQ